MSIATPLSSLSDDSLFHEYVANASANAFRVLRNRHHAKAKQTLKEMCRIDDEYADATVNRVWQTITEHRNFLAQFSSFSRRLHRLVEIEGRRLIRQGHERRSNVRSSSCQE